MDETPMDETDEDEYESEQVATLIELRELRAENAALRSALNECGVDRVSGLSG